MLAKLQAQIRKGSVPTHFITFCGTFLDNTVDNIAMSVNSGEKTGERCLVFGQYPIGPSIRLGRHLLHLAHLGQAKCQGEWKAGQIP